MTIPPFFPQFALTELLQPPGSIRGESQPETDPELFKECDRQAKTHIAILVPPRGTEELFARKKCEPLTVRPSKARARPANGVQQHFLLSSPY